MRYRIALTLIILISVAFSPTGYSRAERGTMLRVVATTTQAADAVRILAGDRVHLTALMGAGVDPHLYKPTEADIAAMNQADLVIYSGLHLEGQFDEVFKALGERDIRTYAAATPVLEAGFVMEVASGAHDPHFWFDPLNWAMAVDGIAAVLGESDPPNAAFYRTNADAYIRHLEALSAWGVEAMSVVPAEHRILVTSHDAFQYFAAAFGWKVGAIQGISTVTEASVADIQKVAKAVIAAQIPVIFVESSVPKRTVEAVVEACKAQGVSVQMGIRELYSDAMDAPGKYGGTYIGMLTHNILTIVKSFGYDVPSFPQTLLPQPPPELL
ncbi:MAG TPA: zinc ABC transporter substrate-binding protein [Aggregatilineales bacterium]|nr:zinc ABC transporter substrate-binding protein [Anaerolineales bacterium]HRE48354.1 zinc ABC transporter substrate-binding protein [Aggregatilineales bacterium]